MPAAESATRDRILSAARQEFLEKGYKGAWLRDIAKKAGVTTGALYGYFKNKEELFGALVSGPYDGIQELYREMLAQFSSMPMECQRNQMTDYAIEGMIQMADYVYANRDAFKLLLSCAEDTEYADLVTAMALLDEEGNRTFEQQCSEDGTTVQPVAPRIEHILTTGLFTMFFELIVHDIPKEESREYIRILVKFFTSGYAGIMGF